jgi:quinol monooxygenase YgiN
MPGPIIYVGTHGIQPGKAEVARAASATLASHLQANHPTYLKFQISISDDGERMTVLQVHSDEDSMLKHLQLAGDKIAAAYEFLSGTIAIDIFGDPSPELVASITGMAGDAPLSIHRPQHGFSRLPTSVDA